MYSQRESISDKKKEKSVSVIHQVCNNVFPSFLRNVALIMFIVTSTQNKFKSFAYLKHLMACMSLHYALQSSFSLLH